MIRLFFFALVLAAPAVAQQRTDPHGDPLPEGAIARFGTLRYRIPAGPWSLSADGKKLAVESSTVVTLYDVETGKPGIRIPFAGHRASEFPPGPIALSPDGKYLVTVLHRDLRIWDTATGRSRINLELPADGRKIYFFPGTTHFAVTEYDTRLWVYDVQTGRRVEAPKPEASIEVLAPSGRCFLGTTDSIRHVVDARTGKLRCRLTATKGYPEWPTVMSPDDSRVYRVTPDGGLQLFDAGSGEVLVELAQRPDWAGVGGGTGLALSPDGDVAYLWRNGFPTHRRDLRAGKWLAPLPDMGSGRLVPHPDGKRVLFLGEDGVLRRYDLATLKEIPPADGFVGQVAAVASPDGRWVATRSGLYTSRIDLFDATGRIAWSMEAENEALPSWHPDGRLVVAGPRGVEFRDPANGKLVRAFTEPDSRLGVLPILAFVPDRKQLVVTYDHGSFIKILDARSGKYVDGGAIGVRGGTPALSPDGAILAVGSLGRGVCLIDVATRDVRVPWTDPPPGCKSFKTADVLFSPDGSYLLDWDEGAVAVLRDPVTCERRRSFNAGADVWAFAISPDGLWLATGTTEGMVALWDVASGRQVWARYGHTGQVTRVAFAGPSRLVSSSSDLTAVLWDLTAEKKPRTALWDALAGSNAMEAFEAACALGADPFAPDLLRRRIEPAKPVPPEDVKRWIADLAADKFSVRESATKALRDVGRRVEPDLRAARAATASAEVRMRLDGLLAELTRERSAAEMVHARAVAALERLGSDAARKVLADWAAGAPAARLTLDARSALQRLRAAAEPGH